MRTLLFVLAFSSIVSNRATSEELTCQELLHRGEPAFFPDLILKPEQINYKTYGQPNKPALVLLHGLGGSGDSWTMMAKKFSEKYYVIVPDARGHGRTVALGEAYSSSMMAADVNSLLSSLNVQKANILGWSMGARTAIRFAQMFPDKTSTVVLEDMHMKGRSKLLPDYLEAYRARLKSKDKVFNSMAELQKFLTATFKGKKDINHRIQSALDCCVTEGPGPNQFTYSEKGGSGYILWSQQGLQEDLTLALKAVKAPILFLAGDAKRNLSTVLFGIGVDHAKQNRPDATIITFADAGHGLHYDYPVDFLQVTDAFFNGKPLTQWIEKFKKLDETLPIPEFLEPASDD